ncbi:glycosyltransferase family 2 protein [Methylosinus sp. KRF6]|uniref:glycosyltransferase family 2 protein n=1 Tax=Methylosinus sp. KRF6 TaxID=2846853 RepID=UPI001C0B2277|nr:glycosyltransferase family A protein [Methylosinus sp. KRF6]MBU3886965.1 glycosyltransferase family 2 protein [Methylosinus sp. KRF6]
MLEDFTQFHDADHKIKLVDEDDRRSEGRASGRKLGFDLPLVSIIITNYNYGRFLIEAVDSALAQTYPRIECIIVDDASTDESEVILATIRRRNPQVEIISHRANQGQTAAFGTGFAASSGEYVVFLDADDILLPTFVETHIFVHFSLRTAVGFTSSDMLQSTKGGVVRTSWIAFGDFIASGRGLRKERLRPFGLSSGLWPFEEAPLNDIESRIHFIDAHDWENWVSAPTSGNCFRRDALTLFLGGRTSMDLRFHGDTYLNKGVRLVSGVALIDAPLTIYRIHGGNGYAGHAELCGVHSADPMKAFRAEYAAWRAVVDRLIDEVDALAVRLGSDRYVSALLCLQKSYAAHPDFEQYESLARYIETRLAARAEAMRLCLGADGFEELSRRIRRARKGQIASKRRAPRPWTRPMAEFCLTFGRLLSLPELVKLGDQLWHF